ncbi:GATA zinc finger domain-containing protein 14-like [Macrosteles quadrilineatus]|uniref:GATA zinc finger domain-containing protein 14-like n=1 Tax=Macrosteles quadrilineatus TaxID=74068 RepID=UPI0023E18129|nr:GATA zinc finger domain-containing protein 14-like [Macrosteles quadrilineatus]
MSENKYNLRPKRNYASLDRLSSSSDDDDINDRTHGSHFEQQAEQQQTREEASNFNDYQPFTGSIDQSDSVDHSTLTGFVPPPKLPLLAETPPTKNTVPSCRMQPDLNDVPRTSTNVMIDDIADSRRTADITQTQSQSVHNVNHELLTHSNTSTDELNVTNPPVQTPTIDMNILSEEEIVSLLAERFDPIIQDSVNVQNITTIRAMERLLQKDDIRDGPKKVKSYNNSHQNSRPSSPNIQNQQRYHDRFTNQQAYVPKMNRQNYQHSDNHAQNNQRHWNQQNYRYNGNNGNEYQQYQRAHRDNKPYQRDHYPDRNYGQNYNYNRNHPTKEQNQICAMFRQNPNLSIAPTAPPMDPQLNSHHSSSRVSRSPQRSENHSAL